MKDLSKAEEVILLSIWRLKDNAYGFTVRQKIKEKINKEYTYGTLYGILDQLVKKDFIVKILGEPTPERGGRSKTYYNLTHDGIEALKRSIEIHRSVWDGITKISFDSR